MRLKLFNRLTLSFFAMIGFLLCSSVASAKAFTVVIDPGHGGHDAGAMGAFSEEKNINLNIALKVGKLIERSFDSNDVRVIFTRTTDVFVPLDQRAQIANQANADLFISVHTNSMPKGTISPSGVETYSLGLARSQENLEVAKRENSVVLLEKDYKKRYAGFDPNSPEADIMFEFMQDKNMKQSVHMASLVQKQIRSFAHRNDKGVKQAGFLVLRATAMPSVLVEVGFISNADEESYLNSDAGTNSIAESIFRAFCEYKHEDDMRHNRNSLPYRPVEEMTPILNDSSNTVVRKSRPIRKKKVAINNSEQLVFKIQFYTSYRELRSDSPNFKGVIPSGSFREDKSYKYTYGDSKNYYAVLRSRKEILSKFPDAFIIAFRGNVKININEAIAEFKQNKKQ